MSRDQWLILLSVAIPIVLIALGMVLGWRARRRRQSDVRRPASPPAELGTLLMSEDMLYGATTRADAPLDRIAVAGLGFRARAVVMWRMHADVITQMISGSIGLDDHEWGVTLFADDLLSFKKVVTEMRFDEVSARYAIFGNFLIGNRLARENILDWFDNASR